jgi:hypothetical protein
MRAELFKQSRARAFKLDKWDNEISLEPNNPPLT